MRGRPTVFTEHVIQKLEYAYGLDCSDKEACFYADIAPSSLYNYQKRNPDFQEHKVLLKHRLLLIARRTVMGALGSDPVLALKYLAWKLPWEFGN